MNIRLLYAGTCFVLFSLIFLGVKRSGVIKLFHYNVREELNPQINIELKLKSDIGKLLI